MEAKGQKGQDPDDVVTPADVGLLVEEDVFPFLTGKPLRQVDFRPEDPQNEGGFQPFGMIDPAFLQNGVSEPLFQPEKGNQAYAKQNQAPGQPDNGQNRHEIHRKTGRDGDALVIMAP